MPNYIVKYRTYSGLTKKRGWVGPTPSYARSKAVQLSDCDQILTVQEASPEEWTELKSAKKTRQPFLRCRR